MDARIIYLPINTLDTREPTTVPINTSASRVVEIMQQKGKSVGYVLVVDGAGKLVGIVTERDLLNKIAAKGLDPSAVSVNELMSRSPECLHASDRIAFALRIMHLGRYRHIPLIDDKNRPIGVVSSKDLVGRFAQFLRSEMDKLET